MRWFDAHLDLACLAENGRDLTLPLPLCAGPWPPAAVSFPALAEGDVATFMGTIFTEADGDDAVRYPAGDPEAAHAAGLRQLAWYRRWHDLGLIRLHGPGMPLDAAPPPFGSPPACLLLMECADPVRTPDELSWWQAQGIVAIGMAWAKGSRYAAGNADPRMHERAPLSGAGRELIREMDRLRIVHDASHLADRALEALLEATSGAVVATHSNARALLHQTGPDASQRHLTDDAIREITGRGGIIGLNLYAPFLRAGLGEHDRPTIDDAISHVEHVCGVAGHRRAVGLGSDLDGGFSALRLPEGISSPADYPRLAEALAARGWGDAEIHGFAWRNWADFWSRVARGQASGADADG